MESEKILQEQIRKAPKEIRDILAGGDWSQTINQTSLINNLSLEQKTALENEVLFVLLGMSLPAKLTENIQNSLSVNEMLAEKMSSEIKTKIISPVESFLPTEEESEEKLPEIPLEDLPAVVSDVAPATSIVDSRQQLVDRRVEIKKPEIPQSTLNTPPVNLPTGENEQFTINNKQEVDTNKQSTINNEQKEETKEVTQPTKTTYPGGVDPYREPIE